MKPIIPFALLSAFIAIPASAQGTAVTTPVGYVTENLSTGFNLIGLTLHESTLASGSLSAVGAGSVEDSNAALTGVLVDGVTYVLEIEDGPQSGAIQLFDTFTDTSITTMDDLAAAGVEAGNSYSIRAAATINSVFGADNEAGLQESDSPADADVIWVPDGAGGYDQYYRNEGLIVGGDVVVEPSWQTLGGTEAGDSALAYTDGMFVQRKGGNLDLVLSGEVKLTPTRVVLDTGFSPVSTAFPVGSTLGNSGLDNSLTASDSPADADVVWIPSGVGSYNQYYYNEGLIVGGDVIVEPGWQSLGGDPADDVSLTSGFFIQRKLGLTDAEILVPDSYGL